MIRLLVAGAAGFVLVGCAALDADTIAYGHQGSSARSITSFNDDCRIVIDSNEMDIRSTNGTVVRTGDGFCEQKAAPAPAPTQSVALATISGDVAFDVNSARIKSSFFTTLDNLANQMRARAGSRFSIVGHTDSTGPESYNQTLSEQRARAVADYLVSKGVPRDSLAVRGEGERRPIADNATAEGRRQNRRVEIYVGGYSTTTTLSGGNSGEGVLVGPSGIISGVLGALSGN